MTRTARKHWTIKQAKHEKTALKPARPDSPPPASRQPQNAMRTDAAFAESIVAHDATERETKKPRHQEEKTLRDIQKDHEGWCPWALSPTVIAPGILIIIQLKRK
jgi:hypothetical protein